MPRKEVPAQHCPGSAMASTVDECANIANEGAGEIPRMLAHVLYAQQICQIWRRCLSSAQNPWAPTWSRAERRRCTLKAIVLAVEIPRPSVFHSEGREDNSVRCITRHPLGVNLHKRRFWLSVQTKRGADLAISSQAPSKIMPGGTAPRTPQEGPIRHAEEGVQSSAGGNQTWVSPRWAADRGTGFVYGSERVHNRVHNKR